MVKTYNITKKKVFFLFVITLLYVFIPTPFWDTGNNKGKLEIDSSGTDNPIFMSSIWNSIKNSQDESFELDVEVFGYRLKSEALNPIEYDTKSLFHIEKGKSGEYNIEISLKFGLFSFEVNSVRGNLMLDSSLNYILVYSLDVPREGFFMNLFVFEDKMQLSLAFDGGNCQLCYDGVYFKGYKDITMIYPYEFEPDIFQESSIKTLDMPAEKLKEHLINKQKVNIIVDNHKYLEEISTRGYSYTKYGVVHESVNFSLSYPGDLPDDYWEPYSSINIGIYRFEPSEAQIKSDLQFYNKDYTGGYDFIIRDILAYQEISHGGPYWSISGGSIIFPDEISSLWYYYYNPSTQIEIDVHPWDMILIVDACYSYCNPEKGENPTMGYAFVNFGAAAFVGSDIIVLPDTEDEMRVFWYELCQNDNTVKSAMLSMCEEHGYPWYPYYGYCWRIYGDEDATLS